VHSIYNILSKALSLGALSSLGTCESTMTVAC